MKLYCPITVDLYNLYPLAVMKAQQNNTGRGAIITLTAEGALIDPSDEAVQLYAKKTDGTISYIACSIVDGKIQALFTNQMLAVPGSLQVELQMISGDDEITTPIFILEVLSSNIDSGAIESQNEFTALQTYIGKMQDELKNVDELKKTGLKGDPGEAATLQIGTVTASEPGSDPAVTNSGTEQNAILNFVLPRGEQGPIGPPISTVDPSTATEDDSGKAADAYQTKLALDEQNVKIQSLDSKRSWKNIAHIKHATSGNVNVTPDELQSAKEFMIEWRLNDSHLWTNMSMPRTFSPIISTMYFSDSYRAVLGLKISKLGSININTEWTGGKHGTTVLTAADNLELYVYMR